MRFFVDENILGDLVRELRSEGHDVIYAAESLSGSPDVLNLQIATEDDRIVITEDRDFGKLTIRQRRPAVGVVIVWIREFDGTSIEIAKKVVSILQEYAPTLVGQLTVVQPYRVRQRVLPNPVDPKLLSS